MNGASIGLAPPPRAKSFGPNASVYIGDETMDPNATEEWRVRVDDVVVEVQ